MLEHLKLFFLFFVMIKIWTLKERTSGIKILVLQSLTWANYIHQIKRKPWTKLMAFLFMSLGIFWVTE